MSIKFVNSTNQNKSDQILIPKDFTVHNLREILIKSNNVLSVENVNFNPNSFKEEEEAQKNSSLSESSNKKSIIMDEGKKNVNTRRIFTNSPLVNNNNNNMLAFRENKTNEDLAFKINNQNRFNQKNQGTSSSSTILLNTLRRFSDVPQTERMKKNICIVIFQFKNNLLMRDRPNLNQKSEEISKSKKLMSLSNQSIYERLYESSKKDNSKTKINKFKKAHISSLSPIHNETKLEFLNKNHNPTKLCNIKIDLRNAVKDDKNNVISANDKKVNLNISKTSIPEEYKKACLKLGAKPMDIIKSQFVAILHHLHFVKFINVSGKNEDLLIHLLWNFIKENGKQVVISENLLNVLKIIEDNKTENIKSKENFVKKKIKKIDSRLVNFSDLRKLKSHLQKDTKGVYIFFPDDEKLIQKTFELFLINRMEFLLKDRKTCITKANRIEKSNKRMDLCSYIVVKKDDSNIVSNLNSQRTLKKSSLSEFNPRKKIKKSNLFAVDEEKNQKSQELSTNSNHQIQISNLNDISNKKNNVFSSKKFSENAAQAILFHNLFLNNKLVCIKEKKRHHSEPPSNYNKREENELNNFISNKNDWNLKLRPTSSEFIKLKQLWKESLNNSSHKSINQIMNKSKNIEENIQSNEISNLNLQNQESINILPEGIEYKEDIANECKVYESDVSFGALVKDLFKENKNDITTHKNTEMIDNNEGNLPKELEKTSNNQESSIHLSISLGKDLKFEIPVMLNEKPQEIASKVLEKYSNLNQI